jgi:hypothetical protein
MKISTLITLVAICGAVFYATGGSSLFRLTGPSELPDTITPPNATFFGSEQSNPFVK